MANLAMSLPAESLQWEHTPPPPPPSPSPGGASSPACLLCLLSRHSLPTLGLSPASGPLHVEFFPPFLFLVHAPLLFRP